MVDTNEDDIVTLMTKDGEEVDFVEIAGINYRGKFYAILQPVELLDGMSDDEALVFRVNKVRGEDSFEIELNDKIVDAVFKEYNKLLDKASGKKLKKSNSADKVMDIAATAVKKIVWLLKFIISVAVELAGIGFIIGGIVARKELGIIPTVIFCVIGFVAFFIGARCVVKLWKKRK